MADNPGWVLIGISLLLLMIFWGILLLATLNSIPQTSTNEDGTITTTNGQAVLNCPSGQCATNIFSGQKRCPSDSTTSIASDVAIEVCSPPEFCTENLLPYALQSDGSTNIFGVCQEGVTCRCLRFPQCPGYITSIFQTSSGNPFLTLDGQRTTFQQIGSGVISSSGITSLNTPLSYSDISSSFCTIPLPWLARSTPGCSFLELTLENVARCMGLSQGCSGESSGSACLRGTLAYISDNASAFTEDDFANTPLACVKGESCPCGQIAVWDTNYGNVVCKDFDITI